MKVKSLVLISNLQTKKKKMSLGRGEVSAAYLVTIKRGSSQTPSALDQK